MFIHWGIYSVLQDGEWVMNNRGMRVAQYETLAPQFNPVKFDPAAYVGLAKAGRTAGRPDSGQFSQYLNYIDAQLREPLSNYGPIGGIWFDGEWDRPNADWGFDRTCGMIQQLQSAALLVSNHHHLPRPGQEVQTFERDLPGRNTAGFNTIEIGALPLETAQTMNNSWGFRISDREFRSSASLSRELVSAAGRGGTRTTCSMWGPDLTGPFSRSSWTRSGW
jgi:alpha-L-fucosidase